MPAPTDARQLSPILRTKLHIPRARATLVPRPRLAALVHAGLQGALTLISAPPGFGKTSLLSDWHASALGNGVALAWVSLEDRDNDPIRFWCYVSAALDTLMPGCGAAALTLLQSAHPPPVETVLLPLLNELDQLGCDAVLVLDDYHVIVDPLIHAQLGFLLDHAPARLHLALLTRVDPPLPLARLRARGALTELRASDLRFTVEEAVAFLNGAMGLPLAHSEVVALEARTEGWIAGLQFAALAMRRQTDLPRFVSGFAGDNRFVLDYLLEEVLARQPGHIQTFLLHTAILDRLCGPLCDAVVLGLPSDARRRRHGPAGAAVPPFPPGEHARPPADAYSQVVLLELERANLFIVPLDDARGWYRYHHLFAEVLRERLEAGTSAAMLSELHRRASLWFAMNSMPAEAIQHALAAADWEHAAALILEHGIAIGVHGQMRTVLGWLDALPDAFIRAQPRLAIFHAYMLMAINRLDAAELRLQDAERAIDAGADPEQTRMLRGQIAQNRGTIARARGNIERCVRLGGEALTLLPQTDPGALLHLAHAFLVTGDVTPATERLVQEVEAPLRAPGNPSPLVRSIALLGRLQTLQGRLHVAAATYRRALQVVAPPLSLHYLPSGQSYFFGLGEIHRQWHDLERAQELLDQGMALIRGTLTSDADWTSLGYLTLARLQVSRGEHDRALATVEELVRLAHEQRFARHLVRRGRAMQACIQLAQGDLESAARWAEASNVRLDGELSYAHEEEYLAIARVGIAQRRKHADDDKAPDPLPGVVRLLERLLVTAVAGARQSSVIEILVLQALALDALGDRQSAVHTLQRALARAEPHGYVSVFVDEGAPLVQLLDKVALSESTTAYIKMLRQSFAPATALSAQDPPIAPAVASLAEPLSSRELDVLRLVAAGKSNADIARTLVVAVSTVKTHTNRIFAKLDVTSRTAAIARAHELELL